MDVSAAPNLQTLLQGQRKPPVPPLSVEVNAACAQVLAALAGGDTLPIDALEVLIEANGRMTENPDAYITRSLLLQSEVLQSMFMHYANRAGRETRVDHSTQLAKAACSVQTCLVRTLGAVRQMSVEPAGNLAAPEAAEAIEVEALEAIDA